MPGGKDFCKALHKFAGVENDEDNARRPKGFVEDIDDVMEAFQRANLQTVQPVKKKVRKAAARGKKAKTVEEVVKEQKSCIKELDTFFEKRGYLPAKDITHLLVFQSRKTCDLFKTILEARVASSSLLMEGSIETMQMFDSSMKTGRPIFIMTGTGGASSKIDLVLQHMKYRKQIEMRETSDPDEEDALGEDGHLDTDTAGAGCFSFRKRSKVAPSHRHEHNVKGDEQGDTGVPDDTGASNVQGLRALINKINGHKQVFEEAVTGINDSGNLFEKLDKQSRILWLDEMLRKAETLNQNFLRLANQISDQSAEDGPTASKLKEQLHDMHVEVDMIGFGYVDWAAVDSFAHPERTQETEQLSSAQQAHETEQLSSTTHVIESRVLHTHYRSETTAVESEQQQVQVMSRPKVARPEELYEQEVKEGKAGLKFEKMLGCHYQGPTEAFYFGRLGDKSKKSKHFKELLDQVPDEWKLADEGDPDCELGLDELTRVPCKSELCPACNKFKNRERKWLRQVARKNQPWEKLTLAMTQKYITFWLEANPLQYTSRDTLDPRFKAVAKQARTTFSNVYEPPISDACVVIDILQPELNIEVPCVLRS